MKAKHFSMLLNLTGERTDWLPCRTL